MSIAQLHAAGITLEAAEAVAIVQQLICALRDQYDAEEVQPPFGPPSPDNVFVKDDGSVVCRGCATTPAVSELGIFLDALLPPGSLRVPGGLRYSIARALLNVDVPPFDSLDDLSRDLARHEHGARANVVRGVLARSVGGRATVSLALVDRRRAHVPASALRRELRDADARLYQQQQTADAEAPAIAPPRGRTTTGTAACLAAGLALICAGEIMPRRHAPIVVTQAAAVVAGAAATDEPRVAPAPVAVSARRTPGRPPRVLRRDTRRVSIQRTTPRAAMTARRQPAPRDPSRGVLDRLRLGWLRKAFTVHSDL